VVRVSLEMIPLMLVDGGPKKHVVLESDSLWKPANT
jgi:hypothetical protein